MEEQTKVSARFAKIPYPTHQPRVIPFMNQYEIGIGDQPF
jgi:hypothetical protein